jgi:hypothetical protein
MFPDAFAGAHSADSCANDKVVSTNHLTLWITAYDGSFTRKFLRSSRMGCYFSAAVLAAA